MLWDTLFAYDPTLELMDLICVAMLLRIRWTRKRTAASPEPLNETDSRKQSSKQTTQLHYS